MCQAKSLLQPCPYPGKTSLRKKYIFFLLLFIPQLVSSGPSDGHFYPEKRPALIILDPGHGGKDTGGKGLHGATEKGLVLQLARRIAQELTPFCRTVLTRESDFDPGLIRRAEMANQEGARLFISLHTGAVFRNHPGSIRILYGFQPSPGQIQNPAAWDQGQIPHIQDSAQFARILAHTLESAALWEKVHLQQAELLQLKSLALPAVLMEFGHLNVPKDFLWLSNPVQQQALAKSIARGIRSYLEEGQDTGNP